MASFDMTEDKIEHLPLRKRRELKFIVKILFEEFERAQTAKRKKKLGEGRIVKIVLFGSHARGDWVEDRKSGYFSDFDILVLVDKEPFAAPSFWARADGRLLREHMKTERLKTPVGLIVHSHGDVNSQLSVGRPFFLDIVRDGIVLYEVPGHPFAKSGNMTDEQKYTEAQRYFDKWYGLSEFGLRSSKSSFNQIKTDGDTALRYTAFQAHQATEGIYHCLLLTCTLYSPKSHDLKQLRALSSAVVPELGRVWLRDKREYKRMFELLRRAYIESRYSPHYEITAEELEWLLERIEDLQERVKTACEAHLQKLIAPKTTEAPQA